MTNEKNAVVTGCNRGIGKAILEKFATDGINVWACVRHENENFSEYCAQLSKKNSVWIKQIYFDLEHADEIKNAAKSILAEKRKIDILVNNAGILGKPASFVMTKMDDIKAQFDVNFFNPMLFTQIILKNMMRNKSGSIINISSISALDGFGVQFGYVSSKAALIGATKKLARELAPFNIRVNAIAPGVVDTDMAGSMTDEQIKEVEDRIILKRKASPAEVASVVSFLVSDSASYINGQVIRIDGGM